MQAPTQTHQATLAELTAMAMDIARTLHAEATAPGAEPETRAHAAAAFDRVARCVRRTVLLAQHLDRPVPAPSDTARARREVLRTVEDAITRAEPRPENPDALRRELTERLEAPGMEADLLARPVADIIRDIRRDLGVDPGQRFDAWPRRTPADIARLHDQAAGTMTPAGANDPAWTRSPPRPARPQPRGPDGLTAKDRALHAAVLAMGRHPA